MVIVLSVGIYGIHKKLWMCCRKITSCFDSESESDLFDGSTVAYMGPVYAGKLFVDFKEGETPN